MMQTQDPSPEALQAAQRIVDTVNLDSGRQLNDKAVQDIATIIEREAIPPVQMTEAPYSWNLTATDEAGFNEMFTVRAASAKGFVARVDLLKKQLVERGYKPQTRYGNGQRTTPRAAETEPAPMCAIHNKPMAKVAGKNGSGFWSCHEKLNDGTYCPYKPPKAWF